MIERRQKRSLTCRPGSLGWWYRFVVCILFVGHLNYVPVHLAIELHDHGVPAASDCAPTATTIEHAHGHQGDHIPHYAADHLLRVSVASSPTQVDVSVCLSSDHGSSPVVTPVVSRFLYERGRPPGVAPPDPLQPRAPPLA